MVSIKENYKAILLVLITAVTFIFLLKIKKNDDFIYQTTTTPSIEVSVSNTFLKEKEKKVIILDSLSPEILIVHKQPITSIKLDDSPNILEELSLIKAVRLDNSTIYLEIPHVLQPKLHTIEIVDNNRRTTLFSFILVLRDEFTYPLSESPFWIIPDSTKQSHQKSWYTKGGVLRIDKLPAGPRASLAFQYTFRDDVVIDFVFESNSEVVNLVVYFLQSYKSLVIGDGDNQRVALVDKGDIRLAKNFLIEPEKKYSVRVARKNFIYKLFIKELNEHTDLNINNFDGIEPVLIFQEESPEKITNHIGFTVLGGTGGVKIDRVLITGYAILEEN